MQYKKMMYFLKGLNTKSSHCFRDLVLPRHLFLQYRNFLLTVPYERVHVRYLHVYFVLIFIFI